MLYETSRHAISLVVAFFLTQHALAGTGLVLTFVAWGLWVLSSTNPPLFFAGKLVPGEFVTFVFTIQQSVGQVTQFGPSATY